MFPREKIAGKGLRCGLPLDYVQLNTSNLNFYNSYITSIGNGITKHFIQQKYISN